MESNQHLSPSLAQEYILKTENKCQQDGDGYKKSSQETAIFKAQVRRPARPGGGLAPFSSPSSGAWFLVWNRVFVKKL
ncbi:hypothetical protein [Algoriphagus formosus]|uniref:Uncharacterized protein n=1 Tax=Algoriphagus formosus TaxID=2007308 RepID=A0A4V3AQM9_9BACT|nr:hypothetical protein [Algoriphagus aquimaris]TDK43357.1 hypothetical protein E1898_12155 [Algoriphagus aquimaris]